MFVATLLDVSKGRGAQLSNVRLSADSSIDAGKVEEFEHSIQGVDAATKIEDEKHVDVNKDDVQQDTLSFDDIDCFCDNIFMNIP